MHPSTNPRLVAGARLSLIFRAGASDDDIVLDQITRELNFHFDLGERFVLENFCLHGRFLKNKGGLSFSLSGVFCLSSRWISSRSKCRLRLVR
jgi:hypothetical protein